MSILSGIRQLFKSPFDNHIAHELYVAIVAQARLPIFYGSYEVQDTPEGRFDLVALHTYLVIRRLLEQEKQNTDLTQSLFDLMFADLDQNLREMSYGDTGVAKRIRKMAEGYYGRVKAYDEGLEAGDPSVLEDALDRNMYRDTAQSSAALSAMASYVRAQAANLDTQKVNEISTGTVSFCVPEAISESNQAGNGNDE